MLKQHNIHYANVTINSEWGDDIQSGDLSVIIDSGQKCAVGVEGVVDPGNVLNDTVSVSTLTNKHSTNIAKSSDEHNEHSGNTSSITYALTSDEEHSDAELKEDYSRDPSYTINEENTNLVAKTFDGQNEHSADTLNLIEMCDTDTNDSDAELKEDQEALECQQDLTRDALLSVDQFDSLENDMYQCAPSENNIPKYIFTG